MPNEERVNRPYAEQGMENHIQIRFPERPEVIIMSDDRAKALAEELLKLVNQDGESQQ